MRSITNIIFLEPKLWVFHCRPIDLWVKKLAQQLTWYLFSPLMCQSFVLPPYMLLAPHIFSILVVSPPLPHTASFANFYNALSIAIFTSWANIQHHQHHQPLPSLTDTIFESLQVETNPPHKPSLPSIHPQNGMTRLSRNWVQRQRQYH